jgi:fatty acid amide hydrolase
VEDLVLTMEAFLGERLYKEDLSVPRLPFRMDVLRSNAPLRIGYYVTDGFFEPCPAVKRAVNTAVKALTAMPGVTLVPFAPPNVATAIALFYSVMSADGGMKGFIDCLQVCVCVCMWGWWPVVLRIRCSADGPRCRAHALCVSRS